MTLDTALLTKLWWALATNRRYQPYLGCLNLETFRAEVDKEGIRLFTHLLPSVGRSLDAFHANCVVDRDTLILDFAYHRAKAGDPVAVDCVRQLAYLFYKLEVPYDSELVARFISEFIKNDSELASIDGSHFNDSHRMEMRRLIGRALHRTRPREIKPSHGNGATACRTKSHDKYHTIKFNSKLDDVYAYSDHFFVSYTHLTDELADLETAEPGCPTARVCIVPKDSRGPRIISCEPLENLFIQQGLMKLMYRHLETNVVTRGYLNFTDQTINRDLARLSSIDNSLATIDMKDASDRVSLSLVQDVFPEEWVECLLACRTSATCLPDGTTIELRKFATMGSSVCFPVEALVFWASCSATLRRIGVKADAYVYGDDIIVPALHAGAIMADLERLDFRVNKHKSFVTGPFRESCGGDYYLGNNCTPVRVKKWFDSSILGVDRGAAFCNELIAKFDYGSVCELIDIVQSICRYTFPRTELDVPCTIRSSPASSNDVVFRRRFNKALQRHEHLILSSRCNVIQRHPASWREMLKWFLTRKDYSPTDDLSLPHISGGSDLLPGQYADPRSVRKAWKWTWLG